MLDQPDGLLVDPSLVLSENGLTWLEETDVSGISVSAVFYEQLRQFNVDLLGQFGVAEEETLARAARVLEVAQHFSYTAHPPDLEPHVAAVLSYLLYESTDPAARVFADEWVFLQTHSWIAARARQFADAFKSAGASCLEVGGHIAEELARRTLRIPNEKVPRAITPEMYARAGVKWLAVGGPAILTLFVPPLGAASTIVGGIFILIDP